MGQTPAWSLEGSFLCLGPLGFPSGGVKVYPGCTRSATIRLLRGFSGTLKQTVPLGLGFLYGFRANLYSSFHVFIHLPPPHGPPLNQLSTFPFMSSPLTLFFPSPPSFLTSGLYTFENSFLNKHVPTRVFFVLCSESPCMAGDPCLLKLHLEYLGWGQEGATPLSLVPYCLPFSSEAHLSARWSPPSQNHLYFLPDVMGR